MVNHMKNTKYTEVVFKKSKKELFYKTMTSVFIRGLLLLIPYFWSKVINHISENNYHDSYYLLATILILAIFYYISQYLNQISWFKFYNKIYMEYTNIATKNCLESIKQTSLAEYTNIINNDIDIICNFTGNNVVRFIQIIESIIIYVYFLSLNFYIFLITVTVSVIMIIIILLSGKQVKKENIKRKNDLDKKTVSAHELYNYIKNNKYNQNILIKFNKNTIEYLKSNYNYNLIAQAFIYLVLGTIEVCKYGLIFYGIYLVSIGKMEVGTIVLIYTYFEKLITNFEVVGIINAEYQSFVVSLKRINKINENK